MGRRILIVDDEPYILRILSFKLRREGFVTFSAESAEEAEILLAEHHVDLLLLDVALATPTNGFALADRLRCNARTQHLPIIMLTARGFASDILRSRQVGAVGYITKPFSAEEVILRVRAVLEARPETYAKR
ncbi:MAG: response regulator transcription factor [Thermoanaerobaculales bacterium]